MKKRLDEDTLDILLDITDWLRKVFNYIEDLDLDEDEENMMAALTSIATARFHLLDAAKNKLSILQDEISNS